MEVADTVRKATPGDLPQISADCRLAMPPGGSVPLLDLAPEGVDPGVPQVWDFLEGLMGLPGQDLEAHIRDSRGDRSTEAWRQDAVEFAGQDEGRGGDLREAVRGVVRKAHVDLCLKGLDGLPVGKARVSSTIWATEPSACRAGCRSR